MNRRYFLKHTAVGFPILFISPQSFSNSISQKKKILILIELKGGNDGLNTIVPYKQSAYYSLRPKIAIPEDSLIKTTQTTRRELGFHPSLKNLSKLVSNNEAAILQGLGYPEPNLSHFRSMDIWHTADPKEQNLLSKGWLETLITDKNQQAISFSSDLGAFEGSPNNVFVIENKKKRYSIKKQNQTLNQNKLKYSNNPSLMHVLSVKAQFNELKKILRQTKGFKNIPKSSFNNQIISLLQIASSSHPSSLFKLHLGSFDTHKNQDTTHKKLLDQLDTGIGFLEQYLKQKQLWNQTLIVTYSEFGRRIKENKSQGTDHGEAGVHFATGGLVKAGLYGSYPVINKAHQNLQFNLDFRTVYASILKDQFHVSNLKSPLVKNFYKASQSFLKTA